MIISASRRSDIPNYYSEWFINRIKEGYLYVRNPINAHQISKISLSPDVVDCIVFWTKNPKNMLNRLCELKDYQYYFQFTLTGYGKDVEPNLPSKQDEIIPTFIELSKKIGREKVIWRYDPILINSKYSIEYHIKAFTKIAERLHRYTEKVIISFVDLYAKTLRNTRNLDLLQLTKNEMREIAGQLSIIAKSYHLMIESCAEEIDLEDVGVQHGRCIDDKLISKIINCDLKVKKDPNQRSECGCMESIEIGTYNTCLNGCKYCYANYNETKVKNNADIYSKRSPLLCGAIGKDDIVTERAVQSLRIEQLKFSV